MNSTAQFQEGQTSQTGVSTIIKEILKISKFEEQTTSTSPPTKQPTKSPEMTHDKTKQKGRRPPAKKKVKFKTNFEDVVNIESYKAYNRQQCFSEIDLFVASSPAESCWKTTRCIII